MKIKIKRLASDAILPSYAHADDSGMDICSIEDKVIPAGGYVVIRTGLAIELPPGTEAQIRPRSGLSARNALSILNSPGTVDEGFRGEIRVILANFGNEAFPVSKGMRIAQMVICPVIRVKIEEETVLSETARADGGFGSTGL
ncbi:MAG: dUTP diphosphatase [Lentisphaerae bacterium]|jgi:dUTP pyrophosphatase|nr:dUTP diphosphatase [Lentisphaerota bacterium]